MERMPRWREHHLRGAGAAANNWLVYGQPNGEFSLLKLPPIPSHPSKKPPQLPAARTGAERRGRLSPTAARSESPSARYGNELPPLNKDPRAEAPTKEGGSVPSTAQKRAHSEKPAEKEPPPPTDVSKRNPPLPPKALAMVRAKLTEAARVDALGLAQIESMLSRFDADDSGAFSDEMLRRAIRKGLKVPGMTVSDGEISSICANLDSEKTGKVTMARLLTFLGPVKFKRKEKFGYQRSYVSPYRQSSPSPVEDKARSGRTSPTEARGADPVGSATVVATRHEPQEEEPVRSLAYAEPTRSSEPTEQAPGSPGGRAEVDATDELDHDLAASYSFGNAPLEVSFGNIPQEVDAKELVTVPQVEKSHPEVDKDDDDEDSVASDVMPAEDDRRTQPDTARTVDTRLSAPVTTEAVQEATVVPDEEPPDNNEESYDTESFVDESIASDTEDVQLSPVSGSQAAKGRLAEEHTNTAQEVARRPSDVVSPSGSQVVKQPLAPEVASIDEFAAVPASTQGGAGQSDSSPSASQQLKLAMQLLEPDAEEERLAKEEEIEEEDMQMQDELDELLRIVG